ncbi:MAG: hypothetical protein SXQ77_12180 [Halobacteria archaeon]|nr:hypothetical protein [Halobacteria archaeon]
MTDTEMFDDYDDFVPYHMPEPGNFLEGHEILEDGEHVEFHKTTRDVFDERYVYDMTFGYNLARLNLDRRHPDAGYRYAEESDDVLRAEFTPTTEFCPQSHTLTIGSFRAWNSSELDYHDYEVVKVRIDGMHHKSDEINAALAELEEKYEETGSVKGLPMIDEGRS